MPKILPITLTSALNLVQIIFGWIKFKFYFANVVLIFFFFQKKKLASTEMEHNKKLSQLSKSTVESVSEHAGFACLDSLSLMLKVSQVSTLQKKIAPVFAVF